MRRTLLILLTMRLMAFSRQVNMRTFCAAEPVFRCLAYGEGCRKVRDF